MRWKSILNSIIPSIKKVGININTLPAQEIPLGWVHKKLSRNQFLILSGICVGLTTGFATVLLKKVVYFFHLQLTRNYHLPFHLLYFLLFPFLGIIITVLVVKYFLGGKDGKGIGNILVDMARNSSFVDSYKMYSQLIASAITIGLGGSAGLESPIAVTGAAIGSNFGRVYHLNYKERTLLLAAGSAAGIAAAFNAPIAGVMFSIEILLSGVVFSDFIPLIIASVSGALLSKIILNERILLHFRLTQAFNYKNVPYYILLGILCGFYSRYYSVIAGRIEHYFKNFGDNSIRKGILGAFALGVCCFIFPPLFGDGYGYIKILADKGPSELIMNSLYSNFSHNEFVIFIFLGSICLIKIFATSFTIFSGGSGGNFAPSLFSGAFLGYFFAQLLSIVHLSGITKANFAIVGMAGVMSGVLYAPLTSIFLIAEVTGGYGLFIPLMIVSSLSYLIVKRFNPYSMETRAYVEKGKIFTRETDRNILSVLKLTDILESNMPTISPDANLKDLVDLIKGNSRNLFAIVDDQKFLKGIIILEDVKELIFRTELYNSMLIKEIMKDPPALIQTDDEMPLIMKKFENTGAWNLPVVQNGKYLGFLSKSSLLNRYREVLRDYSSE